MRSTEGILAAQGAKDVKINSLTNAESTLSTKSPMNESLDESRLIDQALQVHQEGELAKAKKLYLEILDLYPRSFDTMSFLGLLEYQLNRWIESIEWFKQAITIYPANPIFYVNLGHALKKLGKTDDAVTLFSEAIKIDQVCVEAHQALGEVCSYLGKFDEAVAHFEQAISLDEGTFSDADLTQPSDFTPRPAPRLESSYIQLACALRYCGRSQKALQILEHACMKHGRSAAFCLNMGLSYEDLKDYELAVAVYTEAAFNQPNFVAAIFNRGNALQMLNRWPQALDDYDLVLEWDKNFVAAWLNRGILLYRQTNLEQARVSLCEAIALDPQNAEAHSNLGVVLFESGEMLEALAAFDKATQFDPTYAEAFSNKGNVLKELRQFEAALCLYDQALKLNSNYSQAYTNRGVVNFELGRLDEALRDYEFAIELNPLDSTAHYNKGNLLKERGDTQGAVNQISCAIELQLKLIQSGTLERKVLPKKPMLVHLASKVLLNLHSLLENNQIPFFLTYGTLLGIYRDGEVLPHDKDLDVGLSWDFPRERLLKVLTSTGNYWIDPKSVKGIEGGDSQNLFNMGVIERSTGISIDFFFFKPEGSHLLSGFHHLPHPLIWRFTQFEPQKIDYKGKQFKTPGDPEIYLTDIYGPNWRIPDPDFDSLVSGFNLEPKSKDVSRAYGYSRLFDQLMEQNWKKVAGYCKQLSAYEETPLLTSVFKYMLQLIEN